MALIMGLTGLVGCSEGETVKPEGNPVEVAGYVAEFLDADKADKADDAKKLNGATTRAWLPPSGFSLYGADKTIGINFTRNGQTPMQGFFFKSSGNWRTSLDIENSGIYYLYGYIPHNTGISCTISSSAMPDDNTSYSTGAVMTINNLPTITSNDLCVVVGAKNGKDDYADPGDYSVADITRGNFAYEAKTTGESGTGGNYVFLLFDHLYAALNITMKVKADDDIFVNFNKLRTIKLKEVHLQTSTIGGVVKKKAAATITLAATDGSDPISSVTFSPTGEELCDATIFESATGLELTTSESSPPFQCYFMPQDVNKLILTSTYDMYDKKGNLLREDCKATNTMILSELFDRQTEAKRGWKYNIVVTIQPTYVYVLSDDDLDNPGFGG